MRRKMYRKMTLHHQGQSCRGNRSTLDGLIPYRMFTDPLVAPLRNPRAKLSRGHPCTPQPAKLMGFGVGHSPSYDQEIYLGRRRTASQPLRCHKHVAITPVGHLETRGWIGDRDILVSQYFDDEIGWVTHVHPPLVTTGDFTSEADLP
jgi:hypothetical protein